MTTAYWMVLIAAAMPYVFIIMAKNQIREYNNNTPRVYLESLDNHDPRKRMYWAHQNSLEIFPIFAAVIIIAHQANLDQNNIDLMAQVFVGSRIIYGICYAMDWAMLRTLVWLVGIGAMVELFI